MYQNVSKCIKMYQNVSKCIKMYQNVSKCIKMYQILLMFLTFKIRHLSAYDGYVLVRNDNQHNDTQHNDQGSLTEGEGS